MQVPSIKRVEVTDRIIYEMRLLEVQPPQKNRLSIRDEVKYIFGQPFRWTRRELNPVLRNANAVFYR